jgi:hypothetical protein
MKKKSLTEFLYIILILFIALIIYHLYKISDQILLNTLQSKSNNKLSIQENFITHFIPFSKTLEIKQDLDNPYYKKYVYNNLYTKGLLNQKFTKDQYKFIYDDPYDSTFWKKNTQQILSDTNLLNINITINDLYSDNINNLKNNSDVLLAYPTPIIYEQNLPINTRVIVKTNPKVMWFLSKKNIFEDIYDINNVRVGIVDNELNRLFWKNFKELIGSFKSETIKTIDINDDWYNLVEKLKSDEIDLIILSDKYPSERLKELIENDIYENYILINIPSSLEQYLDSYPYYSLRQIDLNKISSNYLPVSVNNVPYHKYHPILNVISYDYSILCNDGFDEDIAYQLTGMYLNNNTQLEDVAHDLHINPVELTTIMPPLVPHDGSKKYYYDFGYYTNLNDDGCKYFVGKRKCTEEALTEFGLK